MATTIPDNSNGQQPHMRATSGRRHIDDYIKDGTIRRTASCWTRKCPGCSKYITASSKYNVLQRVDVLCRSCTRKASIRPRDLTKLIFKNGKYWHNCIACNKMIGHYSKKEAIIRMLSKCGFCYQQEKHYKKSIKSKILYKLPDECKNGQIPEEFLKI